MSSLSPHVDLSARSRFDIRFCSGASSLDQHEEAFEFNQDGQRRKLRIHDYTDIYQVPGLYEALVYDKLQCSSPGRVAELLNSTLTDWPQEPADLRVLDLGAGNGIMAEELRRIGGGFIVGLDLLPEAARAAQRDRPGVYDDYVVADLTELSSVDHRRMKDAGLNCLVTVAALGFGDIPPEVFATAFNLITPQGWLAMTIKEDFLDPAGDDSGFARLIRRLVSEGIIEIQAYQRYCHRLSIDGEQLFYLALVAQKTADCPITYFDNPVARNGAAPTGIDPASILLNS